MVDPLVGSVVLLAALGAFAAIGLRAAAGHGGVDDYFVARGSQGAGALGLSFLASGMGAWILFAPPEVGAFVGIAGVVGYALGAAAPILAFGLLGPRLRALAPAGHSLTSFVRARFGRPFHAFVVVVSVAYMLVFVAAELTAVGAVVGIITGADGRFAVIATAAVTLAYTAYGGLRASLRTDRWQAWLVLGLLAVAAVAQLGGAPRGDGAGLAFEVGRAGMESALTLLIAVTAANLFHQGYWQRVWSARDDRALADGTRLGAALTVPVVAVVGLLGMVAVGRATELGSPPAPFFALLAGLPGWIGVAVLVLGVALVASSVDTLENALAGIVAAERPRLSLGGARWATVVLVLPAAAVAVQGYSVLRLFLIADLLCAAIVVPALLGLWRRATPAGALAGGIAGLAGAVLPATVATGSLAEGLLAASFPGSVPTLPPFLGALVASTVVAIAGSLLGRRTTDLYAFGGRITPLEGADRS
jgi:solute:Na+ symporter, SSS family